jgi:AcrR family transcriptional regulator
LRAALHCFAGKGFHAATMDDLVRAAGLSKGSLYWHFDSKEEVFLALFDAFALELYGQWDVVEKDLEDPLDVLRREVEVAIETLSRDRELLLAWAEFLTHPVARERMAELYVLGRQRLGAIAQRGLDMGRLAPGPDPEAVAATLVASVEGLLLQFMMDPSFELRRHFEASWTLLSRGLRP